MDSQIFQVIDEMEEYVSNCKGKFMSSTEIVCNRDKMEEFLRDLRRKAPEEIDKCRKIIARQEAIYSDAKTRAKKLLDDSVVQSDELVSENVIMRRAYEQADEVILMAKNQAQNIVDTATAQANELRDAATQYMEDVMVYLENIFDSSSKQATDHYTALINTLNTYAANIREDHKQLHPEEAQVAPIAEESSEQE
ncbi:MAG: vacuolar family H+-ATPase subunit H [Lachnospiraceae bacterium]|jgi:vacuolar-type H+-ATPase subunit H|nr:vacuolar family H+-ATPase subunit H [Lachnospiraceae bacterium]MBQ8138112.1 vacuolar family H+-ATPase subunit H [Lachnospiraceae bacterium]MBR1650502.1 vacuolar family H+-ATPase subunit H [Lachnospiraceae bacterium]